MPRHANKQAQSPLGHWLLDYVATQQLTLTELSRLAGLSDGTLRSLIRAAGLTVEVFAEIAR